MGVEDSGPFFTRWRWDGTLASEKIEGLPFIVHVRKFDRTPSKDKAWMEIDIRPAVLLNNLIAKQPTIPDVLDLFMARSREFMIVNAITALHRIARFSSSSVAEHDPRLWKLLR